MSNSIRAFGDESGDESGGKTGTAFNLSGNDFPCLIL
jgi:hypothetical protein